MTAQADSFSVGVAAWGCLTPLGSAEATVAGLLAGRRALAMHPVLGADGGDAVPLALLHGSMEETLPPRWLAPLRSWAAELPAHPWGTPRYPVIITSSNFGVGNLYAYLRCREEAHLRPGTPSACGELVRRELGWGEHVTIFSHACVTAHLGLAQAARCLQAGWAERVLVFSFDFVSPFVAGGFHSLKILNGTWPAPYAVRPTGAIGLGDGAAYAVLTRERAPFRIAAQAFHNEMYHFTGNQPAGAGFTACFSALAAVTRGRRLWVKGHGTGTLEAGRLEAEASARHWPAAPLVSWKGSLGHTLGSCGLVELALALTAWQAGRIPGTVGSEGPCFTDQVALGALSAAQYDGVLLASNAFGGAQAALLLTHD